MTIKTKEDRELRNQKLALCRSIRRYIYTNLNKSDINCYYFNKNIVKFINEWLDTMDKSENGNYIYKSLRGKEFELNDFLIEYITNRFSNEISFLIEKWNSCRYDPTVSLNGEDPTDRQIYKYKELYKMVNNEPIKSSDDEILKSFDRTSLSNEIDSFQSIVRAEGMIALATEKQKKYILKLYKNLDEEPFEDIENITKEDAKKLIPSLLDRVDKKRIEETNSIPIDEKVISIFDYIKKRGNI